MNPDAAELSSLMTVVADVALRVAEIAQRREVVSDESSASRLQEIERSLVTAGRRMQTVIRDLDESRET